KPDQEAESGEHEQLGERSGSPLHGDQRGDLEGREVAEEQPADARGSGGGQGDGERRARLGGGEHELPGEREAAARGVERGGAGGGGAGGDQADALPGWHGEPLTYRRGKSRADLHDRPFPPDGAATADRQSRRDRLDHGHNRSDPSFAEPHGVNDLG